MKRWIALLGVLALGLTGTAPAQEACLKHPFTTAKAESTDTSIVSSGEWNDCHKSTTGTDGQRLLKDATQRTTLRWAPSPARESFRGLHLRTHPDNDKAASQVMLVHADEIVLDGGEATGPWDLAVADISKSGAGGLDTGSEVASTWYEVYGIWALNGPAPTPAPTVAIGAAGNVNAGLHSWKLTFVSAAGETLGSVASATLNPGVASQVNLTAIATGPVETTSRKIYRTATGDTAAWKVVGTISNNTDTTFTDNVADASLGADLPSAAAAPATAPVAAVGAAGNVNAGQHSWRVTFVETRGETIGGPISAPINLAVASQVSLTSVPTGPGGTTARKLYRTVSGDATPYKLVGTISDNTTTTFTDNIADGSLGANTPANTFGSARNLLLHRAKDYFTDSGQGFTTADDAQRALRLATGTATDKLAQGFKTATAGAPGPIAFVDIKLIRVGAVSGNIWVTVETDSVGNPSGTLLCATGTSDKLDAGKISTTAQTIRVIFRAPCSTADTTTQYHLVLQGDYTRSDTVNIAWRGVAAGGYANGAAKEFNGTVWAAASGVGDFTFKLNTVRNDTGVTMPAGWNQKAKLGYVFNDASSNLALFLQQDRFVARSPVSSGVVTASIPLLIDYSAALPPGSLLVQWDGISSVTNDVVNLQGIHEFHTGFTHSFVNPTANLAFAPMTMSATEYQGAYLQRVFGTGDVQVRVIGFWW